EDRIRQFDFSVKGEATPHASAELKTAKKLWVASAMISSSGWHFIQAHLPTEFVEQHYLLGTDLATHPKVFEILLANLHINARVFARDIPIIPRCT
ncbi:MAG: hypothetical protein EOO45_02805, partial [Flavobacterium sp.]